MTGEAVQLHTPLGDEVLSLRAGDHVELSGIVYTARDEAHIRMQQSGIPFDPRGAAIYHCGPVVQDNRIIAAGPTTSARMNELSGFLLDHGVRALIGKGGMGLRVREQLKKPGHISCIHRRLCSTCVITYGAERSIFPGSRYGRSDLGDRT